MPTERCRNLVLILGDQLDRQSAVFDGLDKNQDVIWMAEVAEESEHVWSHKARIAVFLAAMRSFRNDLRRRNFRVDYQQLDDPGSKHGFQEALEASVQSWQPQRLVVVKPGAWRVEQALRSAANANNLELEVREDRHFLCTPEEFAEHANGRKQLRLEYFYRELRRKHDVLMNGDQPVGEKWNFDAENRGSFDRHGPVDLPTPRSFRPNAVAREVIALVNSRFPDHPGSLDRFDWPTTGRQAQQALEEFVAYRLPLFGVYQDAMWTDEPFLYHSRLSVAMNLKLLDPRMVIRAAEVAYEQGRVPLASAEGFIRQILGWREYVRGIYWHFMPDYIHLNKMNAKHPLPGFYWTGDTEMQCLSQVIQQTLQTGYAHHIQRLMVTGLFALLLGVEPAAVHEWYLAVYVDAVEWVELPNTLGMSQFGDGGIMASKPYIATGKYIKRMSNYCEGCRFRPDLATGEIACPFTTLYWDYLQRHETTLAGNHRMAMQLKNLRRKSKDELAEIRKAAREFRNSLLDPS